MLKCQCLAAAAPLPDRMNLLFPLPTSQTVARRQEVTFKASFIALPHLFKLETWPSWKGTGWDQLSRRPAHTLPGRFFAVRPDSGLDQRASGKIGTSRLNARFSNCPPLSIANRAQFPRPLYPFVTQDCQLPS